MAKISQVEAAKAVKKADSLNGRMKRMKEDRKSAGKKIAGTTGRYGGAYAGQRFFGDKDVGGVSVNYIAGLVGFGVQMGSDGMVGEFIGGTLEGMALGEVAMKGADDAG